MLMLILIIVIFIIKDIKLFVPVFTLSAIDNQKLSEHLSKGFEKSVYWNKYKAKRDTIKKYRYFLASNVVGVNRSCQSVSTFKPR